MGPEVVCIATAFVLSVAFMSSLGLCLAEQGVSLTDSITRCFCSIDYSHSLGSAL